MLSNDTLSRIDEIKRRIDFSYVIPSSKSHGSLNCPFCHRKNKAHIYNGQFFRCYSSKCGVHGDIINIHKLLYYPSEKGGFYKSIEDLEKLASINRQEFFDLQSERVQLYEKALDTYKYILMDTSEGSSARNYLSSRGFDSTCLRMYDIGYASSNNPLQAFGLDPFLLKKHHLITGWSNSSSEYYSNRIIFPIRNLEKHTVHFIGRYCGSVPKTSEGDDKFLRYKNSKSSESLPSTSNYLVFEDYIEEYLSLEEPYVILAEGYPDALSLKQLGLPVLGLLGLEGLTKHYSKLSKFKYIICVFDNDFFPQDHPLYPLEFKSWRRIVPQLVDLALILPHTQFFTFMVPESFNNINCKDINDWLLSSNLSASFFKSFIESKKQDLISSLIDRWGSDFSRHSTLLQLIHSTPNPLQSVHLSNLQQFIPLEFSPLTYALHLFND